VRLGGDEWSEFGVSSSHGGAKAMGEAEHEERGAIKLNKERVERGHAGAFTRKRRGQLIHVVIGVLE